MANVFVATLGQRPEAITMALDELYPRCQFVEVGILSTDPTYSDIAASYAALQQALEQGYPDLFVQPHYLQRRNGDTLLDIVDEATGEDYYHAVRQVLQGYRARGDCVHLLVSGGRKAMSIYATLAAIATFGRQDKVWTVLSSKHYLAQPGVFHAEEGHTRMVSLPVLDVQTAVTVHQSPRQRLFDLLTQQESELATFYSRHPYATNEDMAQALGKVEKTIENQFSGIYKKMLEDLGYRVERAKRRQFLLDILLDRID